MSKGNPADNADEEESKGAPGDGRTDSSPPELNELCHEERLIIEEIKKLAQLHRKSGLLAAIQDTLFERIAIHLINVKHAQNIYPAYIKRMDYDIFTKQTIAIALANKQEYEIKVDIRHPNSFREKINSLEKKIFKRVNELSSQHPFSIELLLQKIKNELSGMIHEFVDVADKFRYISYDPEATEKRRKASFEAFFLELGRELSEPKPTNLITTINAIPSLKERKLKLLNAQKEISTGIRELQNKTKLDSTQEKELKDRIKAQYGETLIDLRIALHQLQSEALGKSGHKPTLQPIIEQEASDFIQWHLDYPKERLSREYQEKLDKVAGLNNKLQKPQIVLVSALNLKSEIKRRLSCFANGSREQYRTILELLESSNLETIKIIITTCLPIFVGNHHAIKQNGLRTSNTFPRQQIQQANEKILFALSKAVNNEDARMALDSILNEIGIPRIIRNQRVILYPEIPLEANDRLESKPLKSKKKPRKKKAGSRKTDILQKLAKEAESYFKNPVTCSQNGDTLTLSPKEGIFELTKKGEEYMLCHNDMQLTFLYDPTKTSKSDFTQLLLNRINLILIRPGVATYLENMKALLKSDTEIIDVYETYVDDGANFSLFFHTDDKREFSIKTSIDGALFKQTLMLKGKKPIQLELLKKYEEDSLQASIKLIEFTLFLLSSPLFSDAAATNNLLVSQGYSCQPFLLKDQLHFETQISFEIIVPNKPPKTISIIQEDEELYLYFSPDSEVKLNPDLPRFKLDKNKTQPIEKQILNILQTKSEPIERISSSQQHILGALRRHGAPLLSIHELIKNRIRTCHEAEEYTKFFNACRTLEAKRINWAKELLPALNELFLQHLDQFIRKVLHHDKENHSLYLRSLLSLPSSIAREINKHKMSFESIRPAISKKLNSLHELQYDTLASILPMNLIDKTELLTDSEMSLIAEKIHELSLEFKSVSKNLMAKLKLLIDQLNHKITTTRQLLEKPYRELTLIHYAINQELLVQHLSSIKNFSPNTYAKLFKLTEFIQGKTARIYLSGSVALEFIGKLPEPKQPHSDIDMIICGEEYEIADIRKYISQFLTTTSRSFGSSQQFILDQTGETKFEVITATDSLDTVLKTGSHSTHNAYVELTAMDGKLYLVSVHGYVAENRCCPPFHIDQDTFNTTVYTLRDRIRCFLFACKVACKYGQDPLSQALLRNLAERIIKEPEHNRDYMTRHTKGIHPYLRQYIKRHFPELSTWFLLERQPKGVLAAISVVRASTGDREITNTSSPTTTGS